VLKAMTTANKSAAALKYFSLSCFIHSIAFFLKSRQYGETKGKTIKTAVGKIKVYMGFKF